MPCAAAHLPISTGSSVIERRRVRAAVADDDRLRDELRRLEVVLDVLRGDVLAAGGDEDVLLAVGDRDEAVARRSRRCRPCAASRRRRAPRPSPRDPCSSRRRRSRSGSSSSPSSARRSSKPGKRRADGAEAPVARGVFVVARRRALGQAVALEDPDPDRVEELRDLLGERRAARDRRAEPSAEALADLREDEPVGDARASAAASPRRASPAASPRADLAARRRATSRRAAASRPSSRRARRRRRCGSSRRPGGRSAGRVGRTVGSASAVCSGSGRKAIV